ncbi:hypothetical protein TELCIR_12079 [Teladorsagia circumcincta]|uniref:Uncharacterized protein n=1 Tax=Teladorsagia circumcincta TaxID=45464 RepID=A0A2G9U925_TELCI|nr:hypothetical protein TELCIR_12079 [Teladorsagia circumcincta]
MRWATILLRYDFDIEYVKTTQFGQVDGLSRLMQKHHDSNEDVVVAAVENDVARLLKDCIRRLPLTHDHVRESTKKDVLLRNIKSHKVRRMAEGKSQTGTVFQQKRNTMDRRWMPYDGRKNRHSGRITSQGSQGTTRRSFRSCTDEEDRQKLRVLAKPRQGM